MLINLTDPLRLRGSPHRETDRKGDHIPELAPAFFELNARGKALQTGPPLRNPPPHRPTSPSHSCRHGVLCRVHLSSAQEKSAAGHFPPFFRGCMQVPVRLRVEAVVVGGRRRQGCSVVARGLAAGPAAPPAAVQRRRQGARASL